MNEADVVDNKFGFVMQHRSFPIGEGEEGWGLMNRIVTVQECDATGDDKNY